MSYDTRIHGTDERQCTLCRFECATTLRRCKRRYECPEFFVVGVQLYHVRGICTNKDRLLSKSELCDETCATRQQNPPAHTTERNTRVTGHKKATPPEKMPWHCDLDARHQVRWARKVPKFNDGRPAEAPGGQATRNGTR